jgi:membrane-bound inhibitor of C-type lysozyme
VSGQARKGRTSHVRRAGGASVLAALLTAAAGALAQALRPVHYTCADGTRVTATFSPPGNALGSVKLAYAGSPSEVTLPQAVSADGGRYARGDVEFWIKGREATLTRAGTATTCSSGG